MAIEVQRSFTARQVVDVLGYVFAVRGAPEHIRSENGPEFVAQSVRRWLDRACVTTLFVAKASPWENGYVESFNSRFRQELLDRELFLGLEDARWCIDRYCEEEQDWNGAKAAFQRIIDYSDSTHFDRWRALSRLGGLHNLLGETPLALSTLNSATAEAGKADSEALLGMALGQEAWLLANQRHFNQATTLCQRGLSLEPSVGDHLSVAGLLRVLAVGDLAEGQLPQACELLQKSWASLEAAKAPLEEAGMLDQAAGLLSAYSTWWRIQPHLLRLNRDQANELKVWRESLALAQGVANQWDGKNTEANVAVVKRHLALADCLNWLGDSDQAFVYSSEALAIQRMKDYPDIAMNPQIVVGGI